MLLIGAELHRGPNSLLTRKADDSSQPCAVTIAPVCHVNVNEVMSYGSLSLWQGALRMEETASGYGG